MDVVMNYTINACALLDHMVQSGGEGTHRPSSVQGGHAKKKE